MIIGADDLVGDLRRIGVGSGDGVFVHSALSQIGHVIGGPRGLIAALIEAVGEDGLIGMPGFSRDAYDPTGLLDIAVSEDERQRIRAQVPGFDPRLSNVRQNGSVPEAFRSWPGTVRSAHPTSSVLLFGKDAAAIAADHDPLGWATGPQTPWGRLRDRPQMKILLIGVGWNTCSAFHAAESQATVKRAIRRRFKLGTGAGAEWVEAPDVADDLGTYFPQIGAALEAAGGVTIGRIGGAESRLTGYGRLLDFARAWFDRQL
ncbi:MAG: AAC(3) family N-acetyltransferase [Pseudomonadota bacterium]